jgi:hypothetical protein
MACGTNREPVDPRGPARADICCAANKASPGNIDRGRDCPKNDSRRPSGDRVETRMECRTGLGDWPETVIIWTVGNKASAARAARAATRRGGPDRDRSPAKTGVPKRQKNPLLESRRQRGQGSPECRHRCRIRHSEAARRKAQAGGKRPAAWPRASERPHQAAVTTRSREPAHNK